MDQKLINLRIKKLSEIFILKLGRLKVLVVQLQLLNRCKKRLKYQPVQTPFWFVGMEN